MQINLLTAKPAFELMLASHNEEAPYADPRAAWNLFLQYLAVPSSEPEDSGCFQASFLDDAEDEDPGMVLMFARQLTNAEGETRCVQLQYTLGDLYSGELSNVDVWTTEFPDLAAFARQVEALPHFRILCEDSNPIGDLYVEHLD